MKAQQRAPLATTVFLLIRVGALAGALCAGMDAAFALDAGPLAAIQGAGLGLAYGAMHGIVWGLLLWLLSRVSTRVSLLIAMPLFIGASLVWAGLLGAITKLGGLHSNLAVATLVGASLTGLALGTVAALSAPVADRDAKLGRIQSRPWRKAIVGLLLFAFAAFTLIDRALPFLPVYPIAQTGLRTLGLWSLLLAAVWLGPLHRLRPKRAALELGFGALLVLTPFLTLPAEAGVEVYPLISRPYSREPILLVQRLTDFDRDGFSGLLGGGDCAPFNRQIHPGVPEIPNNGIDENCVRGDAKATVSMPREQPPKPTEPSKINVVLITIDALRPDHTSVFGYARPTTPHLAKWAEGAVRFERAYATAPWTSLSISTALRGVYARRLRWQRVYETNAFRLVRSPKDQPQGIRAGFALPIDDPHPTIASWLSRRGMTTVAVLDDGRTDFLSPALGAYGGFDAVHEIDDLPRGRRNDRGTTDVAVEQLGRLLTRDMPFFLWVHYFGPHEPDEIHADVPSFGTNALDRYDHEIRYCDEQLARLLQSLDRFSARYPLAVIVASDHGEIVSTLWRAHGVDLNEESLRVPLLVKAPGWKPATIRTPVSLIDLAPTILALTETPAPTWFDGEDLAGIAAGKAPRRALYADLWRFDPRGVQIVDHVAAFDDQHRVINDVLHRSRWATRVDGSRPRSYEEVVSGPLWRALDRYLEETGESPAIN